MMQLRRSERSIYFAAVPVMISVSLLLIWTIPFSTVSRLVVTSMSLAGAGYGGLAYWLRTRKQWPGLRYTTPLVSVSFITVAVILIGRHGPLSFLLYFPAVIIASIRSGRTIGIATAALSALGYGLAVWLGSPPPTAMFGFMFVAANLLIVAALSGAVVDEERMLRRQTQARRIHEQAALLKLADTLVNVPDLNTTLNTAVETAAQILKVDAVSLVMPEGDQFVVQAAWGLTASYTSRSFRTETSSIAASAIAHSQPLAVSDLLQERRLQGWLPEREQNLRAGLAVPMMREGRAHGALMIHTVNPHVFSEDEVHLLSLIANQILVAIERKQAEQALRRLNEALEEEAKRIAHELHDEAGQLLAMVHIVLAEIARELPPPGPKRLEEVTGLLDQIEEQLRHLAHELRPTILDDLGLLPALEFLAQGVSKRTGLPITVESSTEGRLLPSIEMSLYRIVQQALTNVAKHARATHASVQIRRGARTVRCSIRDDGIGFDVPVVLARRGQRGLGLLGIRERLNSFGGALQINSAPGQGTELLVTIPLAA